MPKSYAERAEMVNTGAKSSYYDNLLSLNNNSALSTEQLAIMACILDKVQANDNDNGYSIDLCKIRDYYEHVVIAQSLMPGGTIVSRQILVTLWTQSRLSRYMKQTSTCDYYEDI